LRQIKSGQTRCSDLTDLPDGLIFRIRVKWPREKYFAFPEIKIGLYAAPSRALEGRIAIVTNVERGMRWTQVAAIDDAVARGR
jgi:hypothetical protein